MIGVKKQSFTRWITLRFRVLRWYDAITLPEFTAMPLIALNR